VPTERRLETKRTGSSLRTGLRALHVLSLLMRNHDGLRLSEVAQMLGLGEVTTYRLLRTLVGGGYAEQDGRGGRYQLSARFWLTCRNAAAAARPVSRTVYAALTRLAGASGGTAFISVPDELGRHMLPLAFQHSASPLRLAPYGIVTAPLHASGAGKCYLALMPEADRAAYLAGTLTAVTARTITSRERLRHELARVRKQGYATNVEEAVASSTALAVPIIVGEEMVAAVTIAWVATALTESRIRRELPRLRREAALIAEALWHTPGRDRDGGG
jgi:DNA-binding IclR family transcriptional regulator